MLCPLGRHFQGCRDFFLGKAGFLGYGEAMSSFIYITDVFCPWCFGFAPVMKKLADEYRFPVRVLCGNLVDEPSATSKMGSPRLLAFFERLCDTTGREIGDGFFEMLKPENSVTMDSTRSALLMAALKKLAPGSSLEQMETFQEVFYTEGRDVLDIAVQADVAAMWGVSADDLAQAFETEAVQEKAQKEMDEAEDILGDFVVYPSLFVKADDGTVHAVARGYAPYEEVKAKIEAALSAGEASTAVSAHACGLDGSCC